MQAQKIALRFLTILMEVKVKGRCLQGDAGGTEAQCLSCLQNEWEGLVGGRGVAGTVPLTGCVSEVRGAGQRMANGKSDC